MSSQRRARLEPSPARPRDQELVSPAIRRRRAAAAAARRRRLMILDLSAGLALALTLLLLAPGLAIVALVLLGALLALLAWTVLRVVLRRRRREPRRSIPRPRAGSPEGPTQL